MANDEERYDALDAGIKYHFVMMDRTVDGVLAWDNTGRAFAADEEAIAFTKGGGDAEPGAVWGRVPALDHPARGADQAQSM